MRTGGIEWDLVGSSAWEARDPNCLMCNLHKQGGACAGLASRQAPVTRLGCMWQAAQLGAGTHRDRIRFADCSGLFGSGDVVNVSLLPDLLHPNAEGYQLLLRCWERHLVGWLPNR